MKKCGHVLPALFGFLLFTMYGCGTANGVLFPRHIIRITNRSMLSKNFRISPTADAYISRVVGELTFRYSRSNIGLEFLFPFKSRMETFTGCGYKHFDRSPFFASRTSVYAGLRLW